MPDSSWQPAGPAVQQHHSIYPTGKTSKLGRKLSSNIANREHFHQARRGTRNSRRTAKMAKKGRLIPSRSLYLPFKLTHPTNKTSAINYSQVPRHPRAPPFHGPNRLFLHLHTSQNRLAHEHAQIWPNWYERTKISPPPTIAQWIREPPEKTPPTNSYLANLNTSNIVRRKVLFLEQKKKGKTLI